MSRARNLADLLQGGTVVPSTKLATLTGSNMPTGTVLQCLSSHSFAEQELNATSTWTDVVGLSVNITASSTNNKIFITTNIGLAKSNTNGGFRIYRYETSGGGNASTVAGTTVANNSFVRNGSFWSADEHTFGGIYDMFPPITATYLDTIPSTNQFTYKVQFASENASAANLIQHINRPQGNEPSYGQAGSYTSSLTLMEIKQ
jgi:hypothetical protein